VAGFGIKKIYMANGPGSWLSRNVDLAIQCSTQALGNKPGSKPSGFFLWSREPMLATTYRENDMRYWSCLTVAALLIAAPAAAQPASNGGAAPPANTQGQTAAKDAKAATTQPEKTAQPAPQTAKDGSIANYDVNGSNASDAMGGAP
jgi:hypothetical protein